MAIGYVVTLAFISGLLVSFFLCQGRMRETFLMLSIVGSIFAAVGVSIKFPHYFSVPEQKMVFDSKPAEGMVKNAKEKWAAWKKSMGW